MDTKTFSKIVEARLQHCKNLLIDKGKEYNEEDDRLKSFRMSANEQGCSMERALNGMWSKHRVSIQQEIDRMNADTTYVPSQEWIHEKLSDNINYTLLLEAVIQQRRDFNETFDI